MVFTVAKSVQVKQFVFSVDDAYSLYVNGSAVRYDSTLLGNITFTLPAGNVLVQYIIHNGGGGESALTIGGDFIDNVNVKFA